MKSKGILNRMTIIGIVCLLTAGWQTHADSNRDELQGTEQGEYKSVEAIGMTFKWRIEGDWISILLTAPTTGWLAVGFDPTSIMKDADIYIGYVADDGSVIVRDDFSTWFTSHEPDDSLGGTSDVRITGGEENENSTSISFAIPLDSGDKHDRILEEGRKHTVILAFGIDDDISARHRDRTKLEIVL